MNRVPPGWNDPPPVPVNYQSPGQCSKLRLLNKRVPFNFSASSSPSPASEVPKISQLPESTQNESDTSTTKVTEIEETIEITIVIEKIQNVIENMQDINKKLDILKRLDVMKKMWNSNELNAQVQQHISTFADSLQSNDIKQANDIYLTLTLNCASVCSSWIIAFKYILHNLKEEK